MDILESVYRKIRCIIHRIMYFWVYIDNPHVILFGVPKIIYGSRIHFGEKNRINDNVFLHASNHIYFGNNVTVSYGSSIITESYDLSDYTSFVSKKHKGAEIHIGDNVWIGANSTILPGVKIENDIVIAAGSVVTHDLTDSYCIYAGVPAKKIKKIGD